MFRCPWHTPIALVSLAMPLAALGGGPEDHLARPAPQQAAWQDLEVGMFIHIAPQTWQDSETDDLSTPLSAINPDKLDTDQWVSVAKSMGAKYIVFVAKHEGGFCWWPTDTTDFCIKHTPWRDGRGDVLADLSASCKKQGIKLGLYLSPQDRKHAVGVGGRAKDPAKQPEYEQLFRQQLAEVLTRYGDLVEVWFDGSLVFDVGDILTAHAPHAVVFQGPQASIRWVGNEDGIAPYPAWNAVTYPYPDSKADPKLGNKPDLKWGDYTAAHGDPAGNRWLPNECDARIRATWFWKTNNEHTLKTIPQLIDMYEKSVGRGAGLLLNNTPDRTGLIPTADAARSAEFGAEVQRLYTNPAAQTSGRGVELRLVLTEPLTIDRLTLAEDITQGERIRRYIVEGKTSEAKTNEGKAGEGKTSDGWKQLTTGTAVGHKKIDRFPPTQISEIRLRITDSIGDPIIRHLAVYRATSDIAP